MDASFQISQLTSEISNLNATIQANNEKINRLENSNTKILGDQDDLSMQKGEVNRPEITSDLWHGKHADDFMNKRESIKKEYNNIMNNNVNVLLDNISEAIRQLKNTNADLSSLIETNQSRIHTLRQMEED